MKTIQISPADNIVVLTMSLPAGVTFEIDGREHRLPVAIGLGHKLAARSIQRGEKIIKYGVSIGSATCGIEVGEHVHLHNMQSDYLPTFTLDQGREFRGIK